MPVNFLLLPSYRVLKVDASDHGYKVHAQPAKPQTACPHCESERLLAWGVREQVFTDIPRHGKRVEIYIDTRRYRCQDCLRIFFQTLPDLVEGRMMTKRLMRYIGESSLRRTLAALAEETGVGEVVIGSIARDYVGSAVPLSLDANSPQGSAGPNAPG